MNKYHRHPLVADLDRQHLTYGNRFDEEVLANTRSLYRSQVDVATVCSEQRDQGYGPHERHRLDVYSPRGVSRATVIYVHGGGFIAGDKDGDGVFYRNIGCWLARQGFTAMLPNYRLAPEAVWPSGTRDLQLVLNWVKEWRQRLGDNSPLVLLGQSAGACHVASWLFDDFARGTDPVVEVDGVLLMSGVYRFEAPLSAGPRAYVGEDASNFAQRSPSTHVRALKTPLWLAVAELDPAWIAEQTYEMASALTRANGKSPPVLFNWGHNHVSTVYSVGSPQEDFSNELLHFLSSVVEQRKSAVVVERP